MRKQKVLDALLRLAPPDSDRGVTAEEVAHAAGIHRHNASADLNELHRDGLATKSGGRPVRFAATAEAAATAPPPPRPDSREPARAAEGRGDPFAALVGAQGSLRAAIEQAKAAMLYPPRGLPTLIAGPTGAGKSRLAEAMYHYAVASGRLRANAPFCVFNCADYAANPQLLLAQLFGYVRGAFTGADRDVPGLIADAEGGLVFLDEIHRLPPEGQEMLFLLMDRGVYRALGAGATHPASVTLIAATSEDPRSSLLHTFVRRFPVVITLPDLDIRPLAERLTMVELFLKEEAARVGIPISVSPLALAALLSFRAAGNVGELRSAVLLGCAKAFLNHMAAGREAGVMALYLTHLAPQIQLAYLSTGDIVREAERLIGVDDRVYAPAETVRTNDDYIPPDLYRELYLRVTGYLGSGLQPRELQRLIQTDLDYYLQRLLRRADTAAGRAPKRLLDAVTEFVSEAGAELGRAFGQEVVTGLALHLASGARADLADADQTLALVSHCPAEYGVVRRLAGELGAKLGMSIGAGEMSFLALFLAAHGRKAEPSGLAVMVIAHGEHTASSMAAVANRLLGTDRVIAVDMPLEQSVEKTMQMATDRIRQVGKTGGIALLVDMGSLTGFGPALAQATGVPVAVMSLVTTPAVIEAARVAGEPEADLNRVQKAVRAVYQPEGAEEPAQHRDGKRMIITTCLTGAGTARKLAAFLTEALPAGLRENVSVEAVDLEHGSVLPGLLVEGWRGTVIAAAGTIDPRLPGVPFIGMEQILFSDGLQALEALTRGQVHAAPDEPEQVTRQEAAALAGHFAATNIESLDGRQAADAAVAALHRLEAAMTQPLTAGQTARWIIHFAFALERLTTEGTAFPCSEQEYLEAQHGDLLGLIRQVVAPVEAAWSVTFPPGEIAFLALIVLTL